MLLGNWEKDKNVSCFKIIQGFIITFAKIISLFVEKYCGGRAMAAFLAAVPSVWSGIGFCPLGNVLSWLCLQFPPSLPPSLPTFLYLSLTFFLPSFLPKIFILYFKKDVFCLFFKSMIDNDIATSDNDKMYDISDWQHQWLTAILDLTDMRFCNLLLGVCFVSFVGYLVYRERIRLKCEERGKEGQESPICPRGGWISDFCWRPGRFLLVC